MTAPFHQATTLVTGAATVVTMCALALGVDPRIGITVLLAVAVIAGVLTVRIPAAIRLAGMVTAMALALVLIWVLGLQGRDLIAGAAHAGALCLLGLLLQASNASGQRATVVLAGAAGLITMSQDPSRAAITLQLLAWALCVLAAWVVMRLAQQAELPQASAPGLPPRPVREALRSGLGPAALAAGLGLIALLILPTPPMMSPAAARMAAAGSSQEPSADGTTTRSVRGYDGGELRLDQRGDLRAIPIAEVPRDSPVHWRANVLDSYDGSTWRSTGQSASFDLWPATGRETSYQVTPLAGAGPTILAPGTPTALSPDNAMRIDSHQLVRRPIAEYQVEAEPFASVSDQAPANPVATGIDDPADPRWTGLPGTVTQRTVERAHQIVGSERDPAAAARLIEAHLRSGEYAYDLDAPVAPKGVDSVDFLLFESRAGFCEHYATASVVMLRSLGIPARIATGYAGGTPSGDVRRLVGTDAHAWVEVYEPGRGWVISDPTPAAPPDPLSWLKDPTVQRWLGLGLLVGAVVIGALVWWWRRHRQRQRARRAARDESRDEAVRALRRLAEAMSAAGLHVDVAQTVHEISCLLPHLREPLTVIEQHLYGRVVVPPTELAEAVAEVDAAAERLRTSPVVGVGTP